MTEPDLARVSVFLGSLLVVFNTPGLLRPAAAREWLKGFPRSTVAGCILALAAVAWSGTLLYRSSLLAWTPWARQAVLFVFPAVYLLVVAFMRELLAARAFGGLLLLAPKIVIDAAAWHHETAWRLPLLALAYAWIVYGAVLVVIPYFFRKTVEVTARNDTRLRIVSASGLLFGAGIVCLGMLVF